MGGGSTPSWLKAPRHIYESATESLGAGEYLIPVIGQQRLIQDIVTGSGHVEELTDWAEDIVNPELPEIDTSALDQAAEDAAAAIDEMAAQQETQAQTAADLERMRAALLNRGRQQTILTGAGGLEAPPRTRRKTLLGE